jgi:hypothetical protein
VAGADVTFRTTLRGGKLLESMAIRDGLERAEALLVQAQRFEDAGNAARARYLRREAAKIIGTEA